MSTATCPMCHRQVSLPTTDDHSVWVRCPLCGEQYALRTALEHVPPVLEILGPPSEGHPVDAAPSETPIVPNEQPIVPNELPLGVGGDMPMPSNFAPHGDFAASAEVPAFGEPIHLESPHEAMPAEFASASDTLTHPEHAETRQPPDADAFLEMVEDPAGEHPVEFGSPTPSERFAAQPPAFDHVAGAADEIGDHLVDFEIEPPAHGEQTPHDQPALHGEVFVAGDASQSVGGEPSELHEPVAEGEFAEHGEFLEQHEIAEPVGEGQTIEPGETSEHSEFTGELTDDEFFKADPAEEAFGDFHVEGGVANEDAIGETAEHAAEHPGEAEPEFRFAANEPDGQEEAEREEERAALGGIATMVQTAPPAKKRRPAPMAVKLVGLVIFVGFGLLGCYLVYGAFMFFTRSDQFHIKEFFPSFVTNRLTEGAAHPRAIQSPSSMAASPGAMNQTAAAPGATNATPSSGSTPPPSAVASSSQPTQQPAEKSPFDSQPGNNPTSSSPAASNPTTPAKPAPTDIAQQPPAKSSSGIESSADVTKTPPPDFDKIETKPDASAPAAPKFDTPASPFGSAPSTAPATPPVATTPTTPPASQPQAAPPASSPSAPATSIASTPAAETTQPSLPNTPAPQNTAVNKPVVPSPDNSADNPFAPAGTTTQKPPIADRLADVDVAMNSCGPLISDLKAAATISTDPTIQLRAAVPSYKAMSHLATVLGALPNHESDPTYAARIEKLRAKAGELAAELGSPSRINTTAALASRWIASPSRKEDGAVIVGTLSKVDQAGNEFALHVKLPNDSKEMTFTSKTKPEIADGSSVVVLAQLNADNSGGKAVEIVEATSGTTVAAPSTTTSKPASP